MSANGGKTLEWDEKIFVCAKKREWANEGMNTLMLISN